MPFDKDSFLKGVITGMRLPRTPGTRPPTPPVPPVPAGIYILTESGEHILTEIAPPPSEDIVLYSTGVWYDTIWHRFYGYPNRRRFRWSGDKELPIFAYFEYSYPDSARILFINDTSMMGTTIYYDREYVVFNPSTGEDEIRSSTTSYTVDYTEKRAGDLYVWRGPNISFNADYPDFEYKEYSFYQDFDDVLADVATFSPKPLITEGD